MKLKEYPDWHGVVKANWRKCTAYLLALDGLCLKVRDEELAAVKQNRVLVGLHAKDLASWTPSGSWYLAVLLCPGDAVDQVVAWAKKHEVDADRIHFYVHNDADPFNVLAAWGDADLPDPAVDDKIATWKDFHKKFGDDFSIRILEDWGK